jgi:hypothetical protein
MGLGVGSIVPVLPREGVVACHTPRRADLAVEGSSAAASVAGRWSLRQVGRWRYFVWQLPESQAQGPCGHSFFYCSLLASLIAGPASAAR